MTTWNKRVYRKNEEDLVNASPHLTDDGGKVEKIALDASTLAQTVIEYEHHEVHSGSAYEVGIYNTDLDNNDVMSIAIRTPDTDKEIHMVAAFKNSSESVAMILEAPIVTLGSGAEIEIHNRNRNSGNISQVLSQAAVPSIGYATENPTITSDGLILEATGIGVGKEKGTTESRSGLEIILRRNTVYAFRIEAEADNGNASISLHWYEHTPKS